MKKLSHTDEKGKAKMVDVSQKPDQEREAVARGFIRLQAETIELIRQNQMKKGDVLTVAEIAGIQGAKRTGELIPLCHPLQLWKIDVKCTLQDKGVQAECTTLCFGKTGVEMEALTGVNIALLMPFVARLMPGTVSPCCHQKSRRFSRRFSSRNGLMFWRAYSNGAS